MDSLLAKLQTDFPDVSFQAGSMFSWSPTKQTIIYHQTAGDEPVAAWSLLHELGHAQLAHQTYSTDFELLQLEVAAWEAARQLAGQYNYELDDNHIQNCLDTYRDWLYQRSTCPRCTNCSLQIDATTYSCFNCGTSWHVSPSRLCRAYRRTHKKTA